jgi:hypothetical protein
MNPAREALSRAVNRAIAAGAPLYVNVPPVTERQARRERKAARKLAQRPFWLAGADRAALFDHLEAAGTLRRFFAARPRLHLTATMLESHAAQLAAARELRFQCAAAGFRLPGSDSVNLLHAMRMRGLR